MGRTRSTSRSVSSTWSVPYDLDLPENKTVAQLKDGLTKRGIDFPAYARKSQLIKLWKNYVMRMTGPVHNPEIDSSTHSIRYDTLPDVNAVHMTSPSGPSQDTPDQQEVLKHGDLHATMSSMASTMERLVNRVAELEKNQLNPQTVIIPQNSAPFIIPQHSQGRFTLETAMSQPVAAASVPNVNTIRPTTSSTVTLTNDNVPVCMSDAAPLPVPRCTVMFCWSS